ncbi:unnamed protein product, partial [Amoebophrya sp. A25]
SSKRTSPTRGGGVGAFSHPSPPIVQRPTSVGPRTKNFARNTRSGTASSTTRKGTSRERPHQQEVERNRQHNHEHAVQNPAHFPKTWDAGLRAALLERVKSGVSNGFRLGSKYSIADLSTETNALILRTDTRGHLLWHHERGGESFSSKLKVCLVNEMVEQDGSSLKLHVLREDPHSFY